MKCDVLFIDTACSKAYDFESLENESIGGTENSTIRLAEGFGSKGLSVVVLQRVWWDSAITSPNKVIYGPMTWLSVMQPKNVIHLRSREHFGHFPKAKHFAWLHDAIKSDHNNNADWPKYTEPNNINLIGVSDWHLKNLTHLAPTLKPTRIYSPVDEMAYNQPRRVPDRNQLVWMSSPHKGLNEALPLFAEMRMTIPELKLVVFNPGYWHEKQLTYQNVVYLSECSKPVMRNIVSQSLCLFYPTYFEETFGLVAAECNAMGVPVACMPVAGLAESCNNEMANTFDGVKELVFKWRDHRPTVVGQDRFRFDVVFQDWIARLSIT